jgi:hypothetical protein
MAVTSRVRTLAAHGGPQRWGEAFLGKAKKSKNLAHKTGPAILLSRKVFEFFRCWHKNRSLPFNSEKTFSLSPFHYL